MARARRLVDALEIIAPAPDLHYEAILDLTAKAFARHRYWNWLAYCNNGYMADSGYNWKSSRIGLIDGKLATHFGIWDHWLRIGTATVLVAGVGGVATDGTYYKQGLMAKTAAACVDDLAGYGYHLTMLHGIPDYYHRFGYVHAWPDASWIAEAAALPPPSRRPSLARITTQWPELDRLHNRQNRALTGTAVRPTYGRMRRPEWGAWYWKSGGRITGYVVVARGEDALELVDHAGDPSEVLAVVARLSHEAACRRVKFLSLHYESGLCRALRAGACRVEQSMHARGGWMVRIVDLQATLDRMRSVLAARLAAAGLAGQSCELLIDDGRESALLRIAGGRVAVAPGPRAARRGAAHAVRGGDAVAQLLIGTDTPDEVVRAGGLRLAGDADVLVRALFPYQHPLLPAWDHY
jgi:predicted N-acetyltransferase YhbS